jgi:lipid A ethanolaminephosphotransferase
VLHTIGSHGPTYYNRYPAAFQKFTPTCDTNEIQSCTQEQLTNTYDNTILYVDYVVDKAIKLLQSNRINSPPAWFIFPTTVNRWVKMASIYTVCRIPSPGTQKHVPMLLWLSADYQQRYGVSNQCLQKEASKKTFRRIICSPPCSVCSGSVPASTGADDILTPCRGEPK